MKWALKTFYTQTSYLNIAICFKFHLHVLQLKNKFEVVDTDDGQTVSHEQVQRVENEMN